MKVPNTPFSTCLSGNAKETELRLRSIFQWKKKRPPVVLILLLAVILLTACGELVGFSVNEPEPLVSDTHLNTLGEESEDPLQSPSSPVENGPGISGNALFDSYVTEFPFYVYTGMKLSDNDGRVFTIEDTPKNLAEEAVINCYCLTWTGGAKKLELYCGNEALTFGSESDYKRYTIHEVSTLTPEEFTVETMPGLERFLRDLTEDVQKYGLIEYTVVCINKSWEWTDQALALGPQLGDGRYEWLYLLGKTKPDDAWKPYECYWGEGVFGRICSDEDNSSAVLTAMANVKGTDFINPECFGNVTAEQLAATLNAAVDHQISEAEFMDAIGGAYGSVFPHWYIENAWLEGGPNTFSSLDRHLSVNCGLPENIVEVTLSEGNRRETAYFEDAALYQMVRHKNDYEEIIDGKAYARFEGELVREMKETLALFASNPGNFTGYELKRFNLAWSYEDARTDSQVELYYFDFGLLTDTPETIGWAGGMALDSKLRVVGVGSGWFAARCRDGEVVCTSFVGNELYYSPLQNWDEADWAKELINNALDYAAANPLEQFDFVWGGDPVNFMELTIHLPDSWKGKVGYVRPSPDFIQFYHLPSRQSDLYSGNLFSLGWSLGALPLDYDVGNGQVLASTKNASYILTWPADPQCPPAVYEEYAGMDLADVRIIPSQQLLNNSENRFS